MAGSVRLPFASALWPAANSAFPAAVAKAATQFWRGTVRSPFRPVTNAVPGAVNGAVLVLRRQEGKNFRAADKDILKVFFRLFSSQRNQNNLCRIRDRHSWHPSADFRISAPPMHIGIS
jgi:hypothetical protein